MPAPPLENTSEGGTDGVTITTGNSGGASGDAYDTIGGSGTITYSNDHPAHGGMGMEVSQGGSFTAVEAEWRSLGAITTDFFIRVYLYIPSGVLSAGCKFGVVRSDAGANCAFLNIGTDGKLNILNAAQGSGNIISTAALPRDQQVRIEARILPSTTAGEIEWRYFSDPDSTTEDETRANSGIVLAANIDRSAIGMATGSGPTNFSFFFDDYAVSSDDWLGPAATPPPTPSIVRPAMVI